MPFDFGISDLLLDEYDRFIRSIDQLSDRSQRAARAQAGRVSTVDPGTVTIGVPGWDDIIQVRPRPQVSPEQKQEYYDARRRGVPSSLAPELQAELQRRQDRWRLMQTAASPEYTKPYAGVMTAIDNVQDFLGTLAVAGRLALVPILRALLAASLSESTSAALLARLGLRLFGVGLPILGLILTAADLLRLLNIIAAMLFPWYAAVCTFSKDELQAGIPALGIGRQIKPTIGRLARSNPLQRSLRFKGLAGRLADRVETGRIRPRFYELIEAAQTTQALFGRGLALGGIVGMVQDFGFAQEQAARGKTVIITHQPLPNAMMRDYRQTLQGVPTAQLHDMRNAANVLTHGAVSMRVQDTFTIEEHTAFLAAYSAALSFLRPWIETPAIDPLLELALDAPMRPPAYRSDEFADEHRLAGDGDPVLGLWALPDNPETITGQQFFDQVAADAEANLATLLVPRRATLDGAFLGAIAERVMERLAIVLTGGTETFDEQLPDEYRVMESLLLAQYWVNTAEPDVDLVNFFRVCADWMREHNREGLGPKVLRDLADASGVTLIRMLGPEAPLPGSFLGSRA